jgi:hypothetical protein
MDKAKLNLILASLNTIFVKSEDFIILLVASIHFIWGFVRMTAMRTDITAPTVFINNIFGNLTPLILVAAGVFSFWAVLSSADRNSTMFNIAIGIQQSIVLMTLTSCILAIFHGYPDGTIRPWHFILIDQIPSISIAFHHTLSVLNVDLIRIKNKR